VLMRLERAHTEVVQVESERARTARMRAVGSLVGLKQVNFTDLALSLYLPAGPSLDRSFHHALLKDLQRDYERTGGCAEQPALRREMKAVQQFLDARSQGGKAVAIFSCSPADFFQVRPLPGDVAAQVWIDRSLHLDPLVSAIAEHPPALLVAVDKERARVFRLFLDEIEELADIAGEPINRQAQGGWAQSRFQRHEDLHAEANVRRVVRWILQLPPGLFTRVAVAGPVEARASFINQLPNRIHGALIELSAPLYLQSSSLAQHLRRAYLRSTLVPQGFRP
jgi:peptide subunit release factor 1 (eRF1)